MKNLIVLLFLCFISTNTFTQEIIAENCSLEERILFDEAKGYGLSDRQALAIIRGRIDCIQIGTYYEKSFTRSSLIPPEIVKKLDIKDVYLFKKSDEITDESNWGTSNHFYYWHQNEEDGRLIVCWIISFILSLTFVTSMANENNSRFSQKISDWLSYGLFSNMFIGGIILIFYGFLFADTDKFIDWHMLTFGKYTSIMLAGMFGYLLWGFLLLLFSKNCKHYRQNIIDTVLLSYTIEK